MHLILLEYYRYKVTFGPYVMTLIERLVTNTFAIIILSLLCWALLFYFTSLLYRYLISVVWLLTDHSGEKVGADLGLLDRPGNPITPAGG